MKLGDKEESSKLPRRGPERSPGSSDGRDKSFSTKATTIIDNFNNALGDTDKSQFLKAISVIDKLSPINFSDSLNVTVNF